MNWKDKHSSIYSDKVNQTRAPKKNRWLINDELLCKEKEAQDKGNLSRWKSNKNVTELIGKWKKNLHEIHWKVNELNNELIHTRWQMHSILLLIVNIALKYIDDSIQRTPDLQKLRSFINATKSPANCLTYYR